jgi:hypothetical protein
MGQWVWAMFAREVFTVHCSAKAATLLLQPMLRPVFIKGKLSLRKQKEQSLTQTPAMRRSIARQKKLLLSLPASVQADSMTLVHRMTRI